MVQLRRVADRARRRVGVATALGVALLGSGKGREAERLVLQLGKHLTEPSGEVTIVKSDPVEINLTADSQEALQNGGAVELRVEQGICSFDLDRR